jgi:hypothetical protein
MKDQTYRDEAQGRSAADLQEVKSFQKTFLGDSLWPTPTKLLERVVSAGRPGPEAEALRAAKAAGRQVGGVAVRGAPALLHVPNELAGNAGEALRLNIANSDATLVVVIGDQDDGDKLLATRIALKMRKPCMTLALPNRRARVSPRTAAQLVAWARGHDVKTLHVTGPGESQEPGIGELARLAVEALLAAADAESATPEGETQVVDVPADAWEVVPPDPYRFIDRSVQKVE